MANIASQKVSKNIVYYTLQYIHSYDKSPITKIGTMGLSELIKITEEEKIAIDNDFDPIEAPPGPYKVQPDVPGIS